MPLIEGITPSGKIKAVGVTEEGSLNIQIEVQQSEGGENGGLQEGTFTTNFGETSDPATTTVTGSFSFLSLFKGLLSLVLDRLPTPGAKTAALSVPVTLSTDGAFATNFGSASDAATTTVTGSPSFIALFKGLLSTVLDRLPTPGAKTAALSIPVTLSTDGVFSTNFGSASDAATTTLTGSATLIALFKGSMSLIEEVRDRLTPSSGISFTQVLANANSGFLKATPGNLYTMSVINTGTSKKYLLLFNKATAPTGADTPNRIFPVAAGDTLQDGFLFIGQNEVGGGGIAFTTGIAWMISTSPTVPTGATASETILGFRYV